MGWTYQFNRVFNKITSYSDVSLLADPVDSVDCLCLDHGVPMRLHDVDVVGNGEVDTSTEGNG